MSELLFELSTYVYNKYHTNDVLVMVCPEVVERASGHAEPCFQLALASVVRRTAV